LQKRPQQAEQKVPAVLQGPEQKEKFQRQYRLFRLFCEKFSAPFFFILPPEN
jgi:hypothetical protein